MARYQACDVGTARTSAQVHCERYAAHHVTRHGPQCTVALPANNCNYSLNIQFRPFSQSCNAQRYDWCPHVRTIPLARAARLFVSCLQCPEGSHALRARDGCACGVLTVRLFLSHRSLLCASTSTQPASGCASLRTCKVRRLPVCGMQPTMQRALARPATDGSSPRSPTVVES